MMLEKPSIMETFLFSSIRYESELHNHTVVHYDASVLPTNETRPLETRSNFIRQSGARPDNYEITYTKSNQQPWVKRSDKSCLVTYNSISEIDKSKVIRMWWFQHIVYDVFHMSVLINFCCFIQGSKHS